MKTRRATQAEQRISTAYHEAGHLTTTIFCEYFGLQDLAFQGDLTGIYTALSGARKIKDTRAPDAAIESVREYVRIAFSGKAAEDEFSARSTATGQQFFPDPDAADDDLQTIKNTLESNKMEAEYDELWSQSRELIRTRWTIVEQIAELIIDSPSSEISRDQIEELPGVAQVLSANA